MDLDKNIDLNTRRRLGVVLLVVVASCFWASETVAKDWTVPTLVQVAVAVIVVSLFVWMFVHEVRRAFRLGADGGEALVHGLMQILRGLVGMKLKDPPKY